MSTTTATHAHPHPLDAASLSVRYRNEVGIAEIPAPVTARPVPRRLRDRPAQALRRRPGAHAARRVGRMTG